jgi:hypothetical protein
MSDKRIDEATQTETMGHEWDGIEELNTPLPRWWLYTFYACIAFAVGYAVVYPSVPLLHEAPMALRLDQPQRICRRKRPKRPSARRFWRRWPRRRSRICPKTLT